MKNICFFILFIAALLSIGVISCTSETNTQNLTETQNLSTEIPISSDIEQSNGVLAHGKLKSVDGKIIDEHGKSIILKGMSSHGIAWFPSFTNKHSILKTKENGANVFRVSMYTEEYGGYTTGENEKLNSQKIMYQAVDNSIALDMYTIIDWHILYDGDPLKHKDKAAIFFDEVSKKYAGNPAVIYEICNEPNGNNVNWKNNIKPYAEEIIPIIRKNSPDALIIVGTSTWSQDVDEAAEDLLNFENLAYAFHFYSGTHKLKDFQSKIEKALKNGATIFVSEWGTSKADGNSGNYFDEANKWLSYFDEKQISHGDEEGLVYENLPETENGSEEDLVYESLLEAEEGDTSDQMRTAKEER